MSLNSSYLLDSRVPNRYTLSEEDVDASSCFPLNELSLLDVCRIFNETFQTQEPLHRQCKVYLLGKIKNDSDVFLKAWNICYQNHEFSEGLEPFLIQCFDDYGRNWRAYSIAADPKKRLSFESDVFSFFGRHAKHGIKEDSAEEKSAAQDLPFRAMAQLARCYLYAIGVLRSVEKGVYLLRESEKQNVADAKNQLGRLYEEGLEIEKDLCEATRLYKEAAQSGYPDALYRLGLCYQNATGVNKNRALAARCFEASAKLGHPKSQYLFGRCCKKGIGVARQPYTAKKMFEFSAEQGDIDAKRELEQAKEGCVIL